MKAKAFVEGFIRQFRPVDVAGSRAWWDANVTGKDEDFKRKEEAQNRIDEALSDRATFAELKGLKDANRQGFIDDPLVQKLTYTYENAGPDEILAFAKRKHVARVLTVEQYQHPSGTVMHRFGPLQVRRAKSAGTLPARSIRLLTQGSAPARGTARRRSSIRARYW